MKKNIIYLFILAVCFSSCVKEKQTLNPDDSNAVIELFDQVPASLSSTVESLYPMYVKTFDVAPSVDFEVIVNYAGAGVAPQDINVKLVLDPDVLDYYNDEFSSHFIVMPIDKYTVDTWTLVIPKGQKQAKQSFKFKTELFDFDEQYALPIKISEVSSGIVSKNYGTVIYSINGKNKYDGIYKMEATAPMLDATNATLTGWYPIDMQLITVNGNSVVLYDGINYVNDYGHPIRSGAAGSYYGSYSPVFSFGENGAITGITNYFGQLSSANLRSAVLNPSGVNKATFNSDGTINNFEVSYMMTQGAAYTPRTYFYEKFTYVQAR